MNKWQQTNNDNKLVKIRENVGCFMGYSPATRCLGLLQNGRFPFAPPQKKYIDGYRCISKSSTYLPRPS